jgi:hypothetical protein
MKNYIILILFIFSYGIKAQLHDKNILQSDFPFGGATSTNITTKLLTFDLNGISEKTTSNAIFPMRGGTNSFYSDSSGNLLYYSNGHKIANKNHLIIKGGDNILDASRDWASLATTNIYLPYATFLPSKSKKYINFFFASDSLYKSSTPDVEIISSFRHIIIDTEKDSIITNKQILPFRIITHMNGYTKHANGRDWWIVGYDKYHSEFYKFLVTDTSCTLIDKQKHNFQIALEKDNVDDEGAINFNNVGNVFTLSNFFINHEAYIGNFDRCTGEITNFKFLTFLANTQLLYPQHRILFSRNDKNLYVLGDLNKTIDYNTIGMQYNIDKNNNLVGLDTIFSRYCCRPSTGDTFSITAYPMVGIDGRIYFNNTRYYMGYINNPDKIGKRCNLREKQINLYPVQIGYLSYFPNYRLGPIDGSSCDTLGINNNCKAAFRWDRDSSLRVEFTDLSYYEPQKWKWDFGDGTTSQDTSPIHTYARSGTYRVCLTVMNANGMDTYCTDVNIINTATETPSYSDHHIVKVYPNPASDFVLIEHEQVQGLCKLKLYDALGQEVHSQYLNIMNTSTIITLDKLASGMYYYTLTLGEVQVLDSGKIILVDK